MMYNKDKIVTGLVIFVALMTFPIWYNHGDAGQSPNPEKATGATQCVKKTTEMRNSHMVLLNEWRDEVLRDGNRKMVAAGGQQVEKSLMLGCLKCHVNKDKFCDECHKYAAVKPYCWDCHFPPKEMM